MADTLTVSKFEFGLGFTLANDDASAPVSTGVVSYVARFPFAEGTGANQADKIYWSKARSLAGGASEELDLADVLADALGQTLTFVEVVGLVVRVTATNGAGVHVGGSATNGFANWISSAGTFGTDQPKVTVQGGPAGGLFVLACTAAAGYGVTAGTADKLKVTNTDGALAVTYDVGIIGRSA
jgi:hypothetical protein